MYFQQGTPVGNIPPQAAVNGPRLPPQAQAGLIGMLPPQAQAGLGANPETTPQLVADSAAFAANPRAYRDGVFGGRYGPAESKDALEPWRDGVFGPALGAYFASRIQGVGADDASGPTLTLTKAAITDVQRALNLLVASYHVPQPAGSWDAPTESAYVTYIEGNTPGYADKAELYKLKDERRYPSARGIFVLMQDARQSFRENYGDQGDSVWANMYETLAPFAQAYDDAGMKGAVVIPEGAATGGKKKTAEASTLLMWGGGAALLGLGLYALTKKRRR